VYNGAPWLYRILPVASLARSAFQLAEPAALCPWLCGDLIYYHMRSLARYIRPVCFCSQTIHFLRLYFVSLANTAFSSQSSDK
jgi:hypothetical protein